MRNRRESLEIHCKKMKEKPTGFNACVSELPSFFNQKVKLRRERKNIQAELIKIDLIHFNDVKRYFKEHYNIDDLTIKQLNAAVRHMKRTYQEGFKRLVDHFKEDALNSRNKLTIEFNQSSDLTSL